MLGGLLVGFGLLGFVTGNGFGDIWTALIGWFVIDASRAEEQAARVARTLDGHTVADLMGPTPMHVPEWTTVAEFRAATAVAMPTSVLLTGFGGTPTALLQTGALRAVTGPAGDVPAAARIRDPARPRSRRYRPTPARRDALELGVPVAVVDAGQIIGVVGLDEVRRGGRTRCRRRVPA